MQPLCWSDIEEQLQRAHLAKFHGLQGQIAMDQAAVVPGTPAMQPIMAAINTHCGAGGLQGKHMLTQRIK